MSRVCKVCDQQSDMGRRQICDACRKNLKLPTKNGGSVVTKRALFGHLDERQETVIAAMIDFGMNDCDIARSLGISNSTVARRRKSLGKTVRPRNYHPEAMS